MGPQPFVPASASLETDATTLHLGEQRGSFTVPVMVQGKGPYTFKIDTGCGAVIVSPLVAREAGLERMNVKLMDQLASGKPATTSHALARLKELNVGAATFRDMYVRISAEEDFPKAGGLDGILGFPAMQVLPVTLDMPAKELRIMRRSPLAPGAAGIMPLNIGRGAPVLTIEVAKALPKQRGVEVVVDTGCTMPLVLPPAAKEAFDAPTDVGTMETRSFFGTATVGIERHRTPIAFPGMILKSNVVVFYADGPVYAMGLPLLRHYRITFDGPRGVMQMLLTDPPPAELGVVTGPAPAGY
ncbi:MAG TPA: retropepsin-like aspartic protease [Phycisphaerae bacterium]|nr:retropepsin-like aspartic protease [Phycisphaerae bacterium]